MAVFLLYSFLFRIGMNYFKSILRNSTEIYDLLIKLLKHMAL